MAVHSKRRGKTDTRGLSTSCRRKGRSSRDALRNSFTDIPRLVDIFGPCAQPGSHFLVIIRCIKNNTPFGLKSLRDSCRRMVEGTDTVHTRGLGAGCDWMSAPQLLI